MAYRWETPASVWLEDEKTAQFELASSEGLSRIDWQAHARGRIPDCAHLLGASLPLSCQCSAIYPEGFAFCPNCGHALDKLDGPHESRPDWWGLWSDQFLPRHVPHGLPVTMLPLGDSLELRPAAPEAGRAELLMPAPPNAHCIFAAATWGFPEQRLLAFAPARGVLQYWDPMAQLWHVLSPEEGTAPLAFSRAQYAWLPALNPMRGEVALVPTDTGMHRLWINPVSETCRTETVFEASLASSPGAMRRHVACLFNSDSGTRLWCAQADGAQPFDFDCGAAPGEGWGRPVAYDDRLTWLHELGQLSWRPGEAPQWMPWPGGWTPRLAFGGPTQGRDGRLWMIGHGPEGYSFMELGTPTPQSEPIGGARLGFASLLFRRGHAVVDEPWGPEHVEDPHDDDTLVLPLLRGFNNNRSQPSGLVLRFHKYTGTAEDALLGRTIARTTVEWIGKRNVILGEVTRLSRPLECMPFVYDGCLWLHHPDWNQVRGWRLEELP